MSAHPEIATTADTTAPEATGLWALLREGTRPLHERLDNRVGEGRPFEDIQRYGTFVLMHHDFHAMVSPLYQRPDLGKLLPDLSARDRFLAVKQDLRDLGISVPQADVPAGQASLDVPTAIGWLYVAEGSNLGAAFLLKAAKKLGLSEEFGARHLAPAEEGRGLHWKTFTTALDALDLSETDKQRAVEGANAAFARVRQAVEDRFFPSQRSRR